MMSFVYTIFDTSLRSTEQVTKEDRRHMQIETALARFETDFQMIFSPNYYEVTHDLPEQEKGPRRSSFNENPYSSTENSNLSQMFPSVSRKKRLIPLIDAGEPDIFTFLTSGNKRKIEGAKQSSYAWVSYQLLAPQTTSDKTPRGFDLVRFFSAHNIYNGNFDTQKIRPKILLHNIIKMKFHFWSEQKKNFADSFSSLTDHEQLAPMAVKMILTIAYGDDEEIEVEKVARVLWPKLPPDSQGQMNSRKEAFDEE